MSSKFEDVLLLAIEDLELEPGDWSRLRENGIRMIYQLVQKTDTELAGFGIKAKSIEKLRVKLLEAELQLEMKLKPSFIEKIKTSQRNKPVQ